MNDLFEQRLRAKIKEARAEAAENLALGYAGDDYRYGVGVIRGYDDVVSFADQIVRDILNGK